MASEEGLKPCPFCGTAIRKVRNMALGDRSVARYPYVVCCGECGASTDYEETEEKAREAWNRRAMPKEVQELCVHAKFACRRETDRRRRAALIAAVRGLYE